MIIEKCNLDMEVGKLNMELNILLNMDQKDRSIVDTEPDESEVVRKKSKEHVR